MHRIQSEAILVTTPEEDDYKLTVRIVPVIPSLAGRHFAASPASLVRVADKASLPTGGLRETYGVTEEDAGRACVAKVEEFLQARSKAAHV
jgi:hypothetical protein